MIDVNKKLQEVREILQREIDNVFVGCENQIVNDRLVARVKDELYKIIADLEAKDFFKEGSSSRISFDINKRGSVLDVIPLLDRKKDDYVFEKCMVINESMYPTAEEQERARLDQLLEREKEIGCPEDDIKINIKDITHPARKMCDTTDVRGLNPEVFRTKPVQSSPKALEIAEETSRLAKEWRDLKVKIESPREYLEKIVDKYKQNNPIMFSTQEHREHVARMFFKIVREHKENCNDESCDVCLSSLQEVIKAYLNRDLSDEERRLMI